MSLKTLDPVNQNDLIILFRIYKQYSVSHREIISYKFVKIKNAK